MNPKKNKEQMVYFAFKIPKELREELHEYSAKNMINSGAQVRRWVNDILCGKEVKIDKKWREEKFSR